MLQILLLFLYVWASCKRPSFFQLIVIYLHNKVIQYTFDALIFSWKNVSLLLEHHFVWTLIVSLSTSCWQIWQDRIERADVSEAYFKPILIIKYLKLMFMSLQKHARKVLFWYYNNDFCVGQKHSLCTGINN